MNVRITGQVTKLCPYRDEIDVGTVTLIFDVPEGDGPELHSLRVALDNYRERGLSHEDFTRKVAAATGAAEVTSTWHTAGLEVTCRAVSGERVEPFGEASDA